MKKIYFNMKYKKIRTKHNITMYKFDFLKFR